jgi:hypothetical protein
VVNSGIKINGEFELKVKIGSSDFSGGQMVE